MTDMNLLRKSWDINGAVEQREGAHSLIKRDARSRKRGSGDFRRKERKESDKWGKRGK